ncbi:MAG: hypothetical protein ACK414_16375, partial [Gemmobacter sp.]
MNVRTRKAVGCFAFWAYLAIYALLAASLGVAEPPLAFEAVAARDWLAENRRAVPPIAIGRFFVHGSHFTGRVPAGRRGILMDAA